MAIPESMRSLRRALQIISDTSFMLGQDDNGFIPRPFDAGKFDDDYSTRRLGELRTRLNKSQNILRGAETSFLPTQLKAQFTAIGLKTLEAAELEFGKQEAARIFFGLTKDTASNGYGSSWDNPLDIFMPSFVTDGCVVRAGFPRPDRVGIAYPTTGDNWTTVSMRLGICSLECSILPPDVLFNQADETAWQDQWTGLGAPRKSRQDSTKELNDYLGYSNVALETLNKSIPQT